ncbi:MAG: RNA-guided endonuclease InsQ/TnpB family protein [Promethearchaeota archaeon]
MRLTELIQIPHSKELSEVCHLAKNLYNLANWYFRQDFFRLSNILSYYNLDFTLKYKEAYKKLPSQTSQQILKYVSRNWKSYFKANKDYKINPRKYKRRPRIPNYKKKNGENVVIFTNQQCRIKEGYLHFPKKANLNPVKTRIQQKLKEVRIIPLGANYKIEIVYEIEAQNLGLNQDNILAIDLGLNNLITTVNNIGKKPIIVKGKVLKSINQFYNKQLAYFRRIEHKKGNFQDTKRILKLHLKRTNKITTLFHRISRFVVEYCVQHDIGTIVIGRNQGWKQKINIGKRNTQNFVQIPFYKLLQQINYKSELIGLRFKTDDESYTSKCSFLDGEEIKKHDTYLGRRISRGLFRASNGTIINADVNAGYNILKKAFPNSISVDGIEAFGLMPQIIQHNLVDTII